VHLKGNTVCKIFFIRFIRMAKQLLNNTTIAITTVIISVEIFQKFLIHL